MKIRLPLTIFIPMEFLLVLIASVLIAVAFVVNNIPAFITMLIIGIPFALGALFFLIRFVFCYIVVDDKSIIKHNIFHKFDLIISKVSIIKIRAFYDQMTRRIIKIVLREIIILYEKNNNKYLLKLHADFYDVKKLITVLESYNFHISDKRD